MTPTSPVPRGPHPVRELQGEPLPGPLPPVQGQAGDQLQQEQSSRGGGEDLLPEGDDKCLMQDKSKYIQNSFPATQELLRLRTTITLNT